MKKQSKVFTLVELLVVIGILGILMGVLIPKIGGAMNDAKQMEVTTKGRSLFQQISQAGIKSYEHDPYALFPRSSKNISDDPEDITGQTFGNSTEYFKKLLDIENYGSKKWRPRVKDIEPAALSGSGVPAPANGTLEAKNVMWCIAQGVTDAIPEIVPVLVTRNANVKDLFTTGEFNGKDRKEVGLGKDGGGESETPFGDKSFVLVRRSGAVEAIESSDAILTRIYQSQRFQIDADLGFDYLQTGASN